MGGFCVMRRPKYGKMPSFDLASTSYFEKESGLKLSKRINNKNIVIKTYRKLNGAGGDFYENNRGEACFCSGTFIYNNRMGAAALQDALRDYRGGRFDSRRSIGHYCIGFYFNSELHIIIDPMGIYKVYFTKDLHFFSSSFLFASKMLEDKCIDAQSVYEYLFIGATFGDSTVIHEIKTLNPNKKIVIKDDGVEFKDLPEMPRVQSGGSFADQLDANLTVLRSYFASVAHICETKISCALSGGYDTRLLLALIVERHIPLELYVYGKPDEKDVNVAKTIANSEGIKIDHLDKEALFQPSISAFEKLVCDNFQKLDGLPTDGIIDNGADVYTRERRTREGQILLNGGAGEIYRNYTYLRDRPYSVRDLVWAFYMRFDPKSCSEVFKETKYVESLCNKIASELKASSNILRRSDIECAYPVFWCRAWMSRTTHLDNRFGHTLLPFLDFNVMKQALSVPLRFKHLGMFEASMIREINPRLAAYESAYHQNFSGRPSAFHIARDVLTYLRPPWVRRYSQRIQERCGLRRPVPKIGVFSQKYLEHVIDPEFPRVSGFVDPNKFPEHGQFNRACTLEYFLQRSV